MNLVLMASLLFAVHMYGQNIIGNCSEDSSVAFPLRGWVGYTNTGTPIDGMTIEVFTQLGEPSVETTVTDSAGGFSFPKLKPGKYFLKGTRQLNDKYVIRADDTITVTTQSKGIACLVAEAESQSKVPDAAIAVSIAEKSLGKIYGKAKIAAERPFRAVLSEGVWHVAGTLYCKDEKGKLITNACVGGVAMADIRQSDGKVLRTGHTK